MAATTLLLSPTTLTLAPSATTASVGAWAWDEVGNPVPVPNGTQCRVDDLRVATAWLSGSLVTVTAVAPGTTGVYLTKGNIQSNICTVSVVNGPASIAIRFP